MSIIDRIKQNGNGNQGFDELVDDFAQGIEERVDRKQKIRRLGELVATMASFSNRNRGGGISLHDLNKALRNNDTEAIAELTERILPQLDGVQ